MVSDYVAAGGEIRKAPAGIPRDYLQAKAALVLTKGYGGPSTQALRPASNHIYANTPPAPAPCLDPKRSLCRQSAYPAGAIKDDARIGNARSHKEEVERLYRGHYFNELRYGERKADAEEVDDLVEQFLDQTKDRIEQERELRPKGIGSVPSGRDRYKYSRWATELLRADKGRSRSPKRTCSSSARDW